MPRCVMPSVVMPTLHYRGWSALKDREMVGSREIALRSKQRTMMLVTSCLRHSDCRCCRRVVRAVLSMLRRALGAAQVVNRRAGPSIRGTNASHFKLPGPRG